MYPQAIIGQLNHKQLHICLYNHIGTMGYSTVIIHPANRPPIL